MSYAAPLAHLPALAARARISVVIPTLNEKQYIGRLLSSLSNQSYPHDLMEVLVVDGGSTDGTRSIVLSKADRTPVPIHLLANPDRTTACGLNLGAQAATGDVILILGAHSDVGTGFIAGNVALLAETGAAAAGGLLEAVGDGVVASSIAAALSHPFGVGRAKFRYSTEAGYVDTVAFAAYRRECFAVLGGFDPSRKNGEDDDFNYRLRKAGGRIYMSPSIRTRYYGRGTYLGVARQYFRYGVAKGEAFLGSPGALGPRHFVPSVAVSGGMALTAFSLVSPHARALLALAACIYGSLAVCSSGEAARKKGGTLPLTTLAFPIVHASYGAGMLTALLRGVYHGLRRQGSLTPVGSSE